MIAGVPDRELLARLEREGPLLARKTVTTASERGRVDTVDTFPAGVDVYEALVDHETYGFTSTFEIRRNELALGRETREHFYELKGADEE